MTERQPNFRPRPGGPVSCVDPDTGKEVGVHPWEIYESPTQAQAFEITGRTRFHYKAEYHKILKIEGMLETGDLPTEFWSAQLWCAENYEWSLPTLLKSTLNPDRLRRWKRRTHGKT